MFRLLITGTAALLFAGIAQTASAADLPMKAPIPMVAPYSWTGVYVGGQLGAGWGTSETTLGAIPTLGLAAGLPLSTTNPSGVLGGGQLGFNWQTGWVVLGVEGDFDGASLKSTSPCSVAGLPFSCSDNTNWLATASGRVGGVVNERLLAYVKGGGAWEHAKYSLSDPTGAAFPAGSSFSSTDTRLGWLLGMGAEYAFTDHWSGFIEYNFMDFGSRNESSFLPAPVGAVVTGSVADKLNVVKAGVNYKF